MFDDQSQADSDMLNVLRQNSRFSNMWEETLYICFIVQNTMTSVNKLEAVSQAPEKHCREQTLNQPISLKEITDIRIH